MNNNDLATYIAERFHGLHKDDLAIIKYVADSLGNFIDYSVRLNIRLYALMDALIEKKVFTEEEVKNFMSDDYIEELLKKIEEEAGEVD